ncbi:unnamed protein product [Ceratitis capitata]|uniref:(Mediterranean fruit fly) hypothetical protein n=1 Tax=Ceratitis capitata TaxID=7213 RepID=A0A811UCI9_CERCA|nr:unnamed protein product [Ceratitis capitata]
MPMINSIELCGNETQRVLSDGPRFAMVFSSGELQGRGFKGKYVFETEYKIPGTAAPDGTCSFTYSRYGIDGMQLDNDSTSSYKLSINFEHFSIEGDPANRGCPAAVLRLWVNVDSDQPPLELCGENLS